MMIDRVISHFLHVARRVHAMLKSPRGQRIAWAGAVVTFFGGLAISILLQPALVSSVRIDMVLIIVLALCPAMTIASALTTQETARLAGVAMTFRAALKLSVMSSAANYLPVPGGPLLRTAVMRDAGARLKDAGLANVTVGIAWMSATCVFVGACALLLDAALAVALFAIAVALLAVTAGMVRMLPGGAGGLTRLMLINVASAAAYALSIYGAIIALGYDWSFPQAAVVATAGVIGAAASITPSGLGVREVFAAGLASLIGTDPAVAFAATAAAHVSMAAFTGALSLYFFLRSKRSQSAIACNNAH